MSIRTYLGHEDQVGEGYCKSSGARTRNRLPNGDFLSPDVERDYREKGWLDERREYTDTYFEEKGSKPFIDPKGHIHDFDTDELLVVVMQDDPALVSLLLKEVTFIKKRLDYALSIARAHKIDSQIPLLEKALTKVSTVPAHSPTPPPPSAPSGGQE